MKKILLSCLLLLPIFSLWASEPVPTDVQKYIDRREGCDHMRGELPEPGQKRRMDEVRRETQALCRGTDARLVQLKRKYAANRAVMQRLNEFEPDIEAINKTTAMEGARR